MSTEIDRIFEESKKRLDKTLKEEIGREFKKLWWLPIAVGVWTGLSVGFITWLAHR